MKYMNNKEKGKEIRYQILKSVKYHPNDISKHIMEIFSITPQAVNRHIRQLEEEGWLASKGIGKGKEYFLGDLRRHTHLFDLTHELEEHSIWGGYSFVFEELSENVVDICHYGFTEMVNNVIDHSNGADLYVSVTRNVEAIEIVIMDDGEGIFAKIKRLCNLPDERQALFELSKGKLTTDPDNHTGEGIFFTSRIFEQFVIDSKGTRFTHNEQCEFDMLNSSPMADDKIGTTVYMMIKRDFKRDIKSVFNEYAEESNDFQFSKTVIPVRLAQYKNEKLVSRSQARRLLMRIEKFQQVIFDFKGVNVIGQAFADEIFRVYAQSHPEIALLPINMETNIARMVSRATGKK